MATFRIRYYDPARAAVHEDLVQSESAATLEAAFAAAGRQILELSASAGEARRRAGRALDVAWWCKELATLLKAGMTVVEALNTLGAQSARDGASVRVQEQLQASLHEGLSLSRAMSAAAVFPDVLVASVTASERTGNLVEALTEYLRYDEMLQRLRRQAVSAAIYPAVVVSLGALISVFLLLYVIPRFSRMYVDLEGAVSVPTQVLLAVSRGLHAQWPVALAIVGAAAVAIAWSIRSGRLQRALLEASQRVPGLRGQWRHFRLAKLYQSLALLFHGGFTLDEALAVCQGIGGSDLAGLQTARESLAQGRSVRSSFEAADLTDETSARLLAVGERSGGFDAVLQTIADRHGSAFATAVERTTRLVEPLLLLVVALVVGGIVVMMYMPIFDMARAVR